MVEVSTLSVYKSVDVTLVFTSYQQYAVLYGPRGQQPGLLQLHQDCCCDGLPGSAPGPLLRP